MQIGVLGSIIASTEQYHDQLVEEDNSISQI